MYLNTFNKREFFITNYSNNKTTNSYKCEVQYFTTL